MLGEEVANAWSWIVNDDLHSSSLAWGVGHQAIHFWVVGPRALEGATAEGPYGNGHARTWGIERWEQPKCGLLLGTRQRASASEVVLGVSQETVS